MRDLFRSGSIVYEIDLDVIIRPRFVADNSSESANEFTKLLRLSTNDLRFRPSLVEESREVLELIDSIAINYMSNIDQRVREAKSIRYCPSQIMLELRPCNRILETRAREWR